MAVKQEFFRLKFYRVWNPRFINCNADRLEGGGRNQPDVRNPLFMFQITEMQVLSWFAPKNYSRLTDQFDQSQVILCPHHDRRQDKPARTARTVGIENKTLIAGFVYINLETWFAHLANKASAGHFTNSSRLAIIMPLISSTVFMGTNFS